MATRQSWYGGEQITQEQWAGLLWDAGARGEDLIKMVAIAVRESDMWTGAHGSDQPREKLSGDRGIMQVNYIWDDELIKAGIINSAEDLFDPAVNARVAVYQLGKFGWKTWAAGPGGWTANGDAMYGTNYGAAQTAVSNYQANPQQYSLSGSTTQSARASASAPAERAPVVAPTRNTEYDPTYTTPEIDPKQQKALTSLLAGFGVDYPDAPRADTQLLTFLRGIGMSRDVAEDALISTQGQLRRDAADTRMDVDRLDIRQRSAIVDSGEARGALSSGATNTSFARQAEDTADRIYDIERGLASGLEGAQTAYNTIEDSFRQQALEGTLSTESKQAREEAVGKEQVQSFKSQREEDDYQAALRQAAQDELFAKTEAMYAKYY